MVKPFLMPSKSITARFERTPFFSELAQREFQRPAKSHLRIDGLKVVPVDRALFDTLMCSVYVRYRTVRICGNKSNVFDV
jgi:hypothetical protein